jgi:1-acyl-sn-glycerol-3-phosphate acyltransferase
MGPSVRSTRVGPIVVVLARLVRRALFRRVEVVGLDRIPDDRPVLLVANHFNGFVDVAVVVASLGRLPRFVAKATIAANPVVRLVLRLAGVVLVQRPEDVEGGDGQADNRAMFAETTAALAHGDMVALFPEGTTHDRTVLARIRTGAARIAFGARAKGTEHVGIVPAGITYYDKVALRSSVLVQIGDVIDVDDVARQLAEDGHTANQEDREAIRTSTELIDQRLRAVTTDFDDPAEWSAADLAAEVSLRTPQHPDPTLLDRAERVAALGRAEPEARNRLTDALGRYHLALASSHLDDEQVVTGAPLRRALRPLVLAIAAVTLLAPVTLFGLAVNIVPALIVAAVGMFVRVPVTKGTVRVLTGLVVFPIGWIVAGVLWTDALAIQILIFVAAPASGLIALAAAAAVLHTVERTLDWRTATERRAAVAELRERRAVIVAMVDDVLGTSAAAQR